MTPIRVDTRALAPAAPTSAELPVSEYPRHQRIFGSPDMIPTGLLFDGQGYAVMAISHAPNSSTPDVMSDKDGDRVLLLTDGDLALQIGQTRYQMTPGDAVQIPRGTPFGNAHSTGGAKLLLIRGKPPRSFSLVR